MTFTKEVPSYYDNIDMVRSDPFDPTESRRFSLLGYFYIIDLLTIIGLLSENESQNCFLTYVGTMSTVG